MKVKDFIKILNETAPEKEVVLAEWLGGETRFFHISLACTQRSKDKLILTRGVFECPPTTNINKGRE